jgi:peptidyl-prolyl cis-trans isomerase D
MLQGIRDRAQGWLAWSIITLVLIAFGFWGISRFMSDSSNNNSQYVAKVNSQTITQNQFDVTYERLKRQFQAELGSNFVLNQQTEKKIKQETLKLLILNSLLSQAGTKEGYRITSAQLNTVLSSLPSFQVNGRFSPEKFQEVLNTLMYSPDAFFAQLRADMIQNQLETGFTSSAFALTNDIDTTYRLLNQTRDVQYVMIPHQMFANTVTVTSQEEQKYYDSHLAQFKTPEQVSIAYIELSLPAIAAKLQFSDQDLKQYYQDNIESFTIPVQWQIAHILVSIPPKATAQQVEQAKNRIKDIASKLQNGASFAQLAKAYSDDIVSAKEGGILPWFSGNGLGGEYEKIAMKLSSGQVMPITKTHYGFELIKLIAVKPKHVQPFEQVRTQVKTMLAQEKAQKVFAEQTDQLSNLTYSNGNTLEPAAETLGLPIKTTQLFGREGGKTGIANNPKIVSAAFSSNILSQGYNSDVIQLDPNTQIVIRIAQHQPEHLQPFSVVQADIAKKLTLAFESQKAADFGKQLLAKLQEGAEPQTLTKKDNLQWMNFNSIGRHDTEINPLIVNTAFSLQRPTAKNLISSAGTALPNGDYALVLVKKVVDGDVAKLTPTVRAAFKQRLAASYGRADYQLFIKELTEKAKIKLDKKVITAELNVSDGDTSE